MSRIGNKIIEIPAGVTITNESNLITVKGPKGENSFQFRPEITIEISEATVTVSRKNESKKAKQLHGTTRAVIANMVEGVVNGYQKELDIIGVGYRAALEGKKINLSMGFSHPVLMDIPEGIEVEIPKNTKVIIKGIDKQLVGEFAANVRGVRPPEPYKGKGIRYVDEHVRRKEGKTAG